MQENNKQSKVDELISKVNTYNDRLCTAADVLNSKTDILFGSKPEACDDGNTTLLSEGKYYQLEAAIDALGGQCDNVARVVDRFVNSGLV